MRYEDVLLNLMPLHERYFDAKSVSALFQENGNNGISFRMSKKYPQSAFSLKRISGDLDRLYRMNLLKRKRMTRLFFSNRFGKLFGRGYMYQYKFSAQGWSYVKYLAHNIGISRQERKRERNDKYKEYWNPNDPAILLAIRRNASLPALVFLAEEQIKKMPTEGVYNRFPIQFDEELFVMALDGKIAQKAETKLTSLTEKVTALAEDERKKRESMSVLQLILQAKRKAENSYMNPTIYLLGRPPADQPEAIGYPKIQLLLLLDAAVRNLMDLGYE